MPQQRRYHPRNSSDRRPPRARKAGVLIPLASRTTRRAGRRALRRISSRLVVDQPRNTECQVSSDAEQNSVKNPIARESKLTICLTSHSSFSIDANNIFGATRPHEGTSSVISPNKLVELLLQPGGAGEPPLCVLSPEGSTVRHYNLHETVWQIDVERVPLQTTIRLVCQHCLHQEHVGQCIAYRLVDDVREVNEMVQRR